ncbi:hypothetical protein ACLOJK_007421 [Asimina triloba]
MASPLVLVRCISTNTIRGSSLPGTEEPPPRCELAPWDVAMLSAHYIQKGFLFCSPPSHHMLLRLQDSLSTALAFFYPLAGRLATHTDAASSHVFVDCNNAGAEFIHAAVDLEAADVLAPLDVPPVVQSFFPYSGAVNHDGHVLPLLAVQLTELSDAVFLGISFNHAIGDGTAFWNFLNAWSEISRTGTARISNPPVIERCFLGIDKSLVRLPFSSPDEFLERYEAPPLRERIFHFSPEAISKLKSKANLQDSKSTAPKISSFQALCAHVWRCIIRARNFPANQTMSCRLACGDRHRLQPPLPQSYFGNCIYALSATTTAGELLAHDLGWAARRLQESVANHTDGVIRGFIEKWVEAPAVYCLSRTFDPWSVMIGSSPRFEMYGNDFGWGKPAAIRSGYANKFAGKVSSYQGREGGSIDLEICLQPESMAALESDEVFLETTSAVDSAGV